MDAADWSATQPGSVLPSCTCARMAIGACISMVYWAPKDRKDGTLGPTRKPSE